jgi:MacB-like periplasmic core domain
MTAFRPRPTDSELGREIRSHLGLLEEEYRRGLPAEEAKLAAKRAFGGIAQTMNSHRDTRSFAWLDDVRRDVRFAVRTFRRTPSFSLVAVLTLALAVGANTAIFNVVDHLLIRPLAYREADRLVVIDATRDYEGTPRPGRVSWQLDVADRWQASLRAFSDVTFYTSQIFQLSNRDGAELLDGATVAPSFFASVGGPIVAGRPIAGADALTLSIVISERLAQRIFNGPSSALGARHRSSAGAAHPAAVAVRDFPRSDTRAPLAPGDPARR